MVSYLSFVPPRTEKKIVIGSKSDKVTICDLQGKIRHAFSHGDWVRRINYTADGKEILTAGDKGGAQLWNLQGQLIQAFKGYSTKILDLSFSPDGQQILMINDDQTAKLWDPQGRKMLSFKGHNSDVSSASFSSNGQRVLTFSSNYGGNAKLRNLQVQEIRSLTGMEFATFMPNGQQIITAERSKGTKVDKHGFPNQFTTIKVHDLQGQVLSTTNFNELFNIGKISPDGQQIIASTNTQNFVLLNLQGQVIQSMNVENFQSNAIAFSPDGQQILSGGYNPIAVLTNLAGQVIQTFKGHSEGIQAVAFSPDGQFVVTGSADNTAKLWDKKTGREIRTFSGHKQWVNTLTFSPDGKFLLTGSWDNTTKLWEVESGKELAKLIPIADEDWVVTTPSGLFDASPGAMERMHFVVGQEAVELEQLKERYFEPGLLPRLMGIADGDIRDVSALNSLKLYPEVEADVEQDQLKVALKERDGGLGKVSLFLNGKEVAENLNPGEKTDYNIDLKAYEKYFVPGVNTLAIRVYNEEDWLKSPAFEVKYTPPAASKGSGNESPSAVPFPRKAKPHLYAIVIGTSDYSGNKLDLLSKMRIN